MRNPEAVKRKNLALQAEIIRLYEEGYSYREIAKLLGISHEWVRKLKLSTSSIDIS